MPTPRVIDISHYNRIEPNGFVKAAKFGIWGVINKCTESTAYIDPTYAQRRQAVKDAGLLWGGYHFVRPSSIATQVDFFLRAAKPDDKTLLALDWEVNAVNANMAREFLERIEVKLGRKAVVYSGNTAKELLGSRVNPYFASHRLWLAQYGTRPVCQRSWRTAWIWQYSGDGRGPAPHNVPGILIPGNAGIDMNDYVLDDAISDEAVARENLTREWSSNVSSDDQKPTVPQTTIASRNVRWLQEGLNILGHGPLAVDGDYGPKTRAAVMAFQKAYPPLAVDGVFGPQSLLALEQILKSHEENHAA